MFETSEDILNLAKTFAVVSISAFAAWSIYYLARFLQQIFKVIKEMRERLGALDDLLKTLKEKLEHSTSHIVLIAEGVKKLVEVIKERTERKK